jgi:fructose-bisphosphate aldolase, class I
LRLSYTPWKLRSCCKVSSSSALLAPGKGILAADESFPTLEKRFKTLNVASTETNRLAYREMLFTTPGLGDFISGVILFDETIRQRTKDNVAMLVKRGVPPLGCGCGCGHPNEFKR